jgi:hypothetical protein
MHRPCTQIKPSKEEVANFFQIVAKKWEIQFCFVFSKTDESGNDNACSSNPKQFYTSIKILDILLEIFADNYILKIEQILILRFGVYLPLTASTDHLKKNIIHIIQKSL